ncbi:sugar isomerase domain-containing protein [Cellulomonas hominis]|uniref:Sugar isomerase domain-containing protein n=1 Tax=Cellulomonas hominis TaxID=156981 RepID=A0A7Z8NQF4_9CELL|nr:sugar isomerase domain-containing protein [Cellulomonas hominis]TKR23477.1 sugar isomerase domain-containing protein [Cellulomonas hominis]
MTDAVAEYAARVDAHLRGVATANADAVRAAAAVVVEVARAGRVLHTAGAGHSLAGVLETFFRAGGLPFVNPLWHPEVLPLNGAAASTDAERRPGLGTRVAAEAGIRAGDALVVFSSSGINPYPVEIAEAARAAGARVVAVTSRAASAAAPLRAGHRLADLADVVLDTDAPPGDVAWPPDDPRTAPLSSLANGLCWNLVLVAALDAEPDLPTWRSANTGAPADHNARLQERYRARVPAI